MDLIFSILFPKIVRQKSHSTAKPDGLRADKYDVVPVLTDRTCRSVPPNHQTTTRSVKVHRSVFADCLAVGGDTDYSLSLFQLSALLDSHAIPLASRFLARICLRRFPGLRTDLGYAPIGLSETGITKSLIVTFFF